MQSNEEFLLEEMLALIENIKNFTRGLTREEFLKDHKTVAATLMEIIMLGEIAKSVPEAEKAKIDIPWKNMMGFRDRAVHQYSKIDPDIVAGVVFDRLREVETRIRNRWLS